MAPGGVLPKKFGGMSLTEVVFTPQSNSGVLGEGAGGVSTHSYASSLAVVDIADALENFGCE